MCRLSLIRHARGRDTWRLTYVDGVSVRYSDTVPQRRAIMRRIVIIIGCALSLARPAAAMVGGAPAAGEAGRSVVLLAGSRGTSCTGVALAGDLVLTAAHCVLPGADYKLVEFDGARRTILNDIVDIARHPQFDVTAVLRHRVTADLALVWPAAPLKNPPAPLARVGRIIAVGDRFVVSGYGLATPGDGRSGGTVRAATLVVAGAPGPLQLRLVDPAMQGERSGLGACTGDSGAPVFHPGGDRLTVIGVVSWSTGPKLSEGCGGSPVSSTMARSASSIAASARASSGFDFFWAEMNAASASVARPRS